MAPDTMFPPLLATQLYVTPRVVEDPLSGTAGVAHVIILSTPAVTFGVEQI